MAIAILVINGADLGADWRSKINANFAALATVSGMDLVLSADTTVADNRAQLTAPFITVPSTFNLNVLGTGILTIL